jgi:hypothetical protein
LPPATRSWMSEICFSSLPSASTWMNSSISGCRSTSAHRVVADDAPGIVDAGVGETEGVRAFLGILAGIGELRLQVLYPGLSFRAFRRDIDQTDRVIQIFLAEELLGDGRRLGIPNPAPVSVVSAGASSTGSSTTGAASSGAGGSVVGCGGVATTGHKGDHHHRPPITKVKYAKVSLILLQVFRVCH